MVIRFDPRKPLSTLEAWTSSMRRAASQAPRLRSLIEEETMVR
jgi:hypothetical protein